MSSSERGFCGEACISLLCDRAPLPWIVRDCWDLVVLVER